MTVVDASVLVAAEVDSGPEGVWAEDILSRDLLAAPHLVLVESANIFRRLERAGRLSVFEATAAYQSLVQLDIDLFPFEPFADRVWDIRGNVIFYDAWYVALAEALECSLATLDMWLTRAPGLECQFLVPG